MTNIVRLGARGHPRVVYTLLYTLQNVMHLAQWHRFPLHDLLSEGRADE